MIKTIAAIAKWRRANKDPMAHSNTGITAALQLIDAHSAYVVSVIENNLFTIKTNKGLKSYTYTDVAIKQVILSKFT